MSSRDLSLAFGSSSSNNMSAALNLKNLLEGCEVPGSNTSNKGPSQQAPTVESRPTESTNTAGEGSSTGNKKEDNEDVWSYLEAQAAFLGATPASLWDNGDLKVDFMDMEEFLLENGLPTNSGGSRGSPNKALNTPTRDAVPSGSDYQRSASSSSSSSSSCSGGHVYVKPSHLQNPCLSYMGGSSPTLTSSPPALSNIKDDNEDSSSCSSFEESNRPSTSRATPAPQPVGGRRKRTAAMSVASSSINDNSSDDGSYVPGLDFDPKNRAFSQEELRPQPMSKKSKKQYVPEDLKDDKYWARRRKNNMAAKRSRDARRVKENQIAMRAAFLENENAVLKAELEKVKKLYAAALKRLEQYEKPAHKK